MAQYSYEAYEVHESERNVNQGGTRVSYFALANDNDEAVVRFNYSTVQDIQIEGVHVVQIDGKTRRISCLRTPYEPLDKCPLCQAEERVYSKFYVQLLEYVRTDDGKIVAVPKVWERPASFARTLKSYLEEYGDLKDVVFKIKRHGKKGSTDTRYDVLFCNPNIYTANVYVKDFTAFDSYSLRPYVIMDKTFEEMVAMVNPQYSAQPQQTAPTQQYTQAAPTYTQTAPQSTQTYQPPYSQPTQPVTPQYTPQDPVNTGSVDPSAQRPRRYTY